MLDVFVYLVSFLARRQEIARKRIRAMYITMPSEMVSNSVGIEILTIDEALDRAATWFALNYTDSCYGFRMTTINFLIAFRLALMEGDMTPDERFSKERYNKVWREMYVSLLYHAGNKMIQESCKFVDRDYFAPFDLQEKEIKIYLQDGC